MGEENGQPSVCYVHFVEVCYVHFVVWKKTLRDLRFVCTLRRVEKDSSGPAVCMYTSSCGKRLSGTCGLYVHFVVWKKTLPAVLRCWNELCAGLAKIFFETLNKCQIRRRKLLSNLLQDLKPNSNRRMRTKKYVEYVHNLRLSGPPCEKFDPFSRQILYNQTLLYS